jgi:hypothetical protein
MFYDGFIISFMFYDFVLLFSVHNVNRKQNKISLICDLKSPHGREKPCNHQKKHFVSKLNIRSAKFELYDDCMFQKSFSSTDTLQKLEDVEP